jgi:hypothetical protein
MRYVIEFDTGFSIPRMLAPIRLARIYAKEQRWPTAKEKPVIVLSSPENNDIGIAEQVLLYFKALEQPGGLAEAIHASDVSLAQNGRPS